MSCIVALCCGVLQCVAAVGRKGLGVLHCCVVLQCVAVCCGCGEEELRCLAVCCSVLQCVAVICSVL